MHEAPIFTHNLIDKRDAEWHFHYGFASSRNSLIKLSSVFSFRLPSIDSFASMSAPLRLAFMSLRASDI